MKKYVYSKGEETVTVETDGLAAINNFMVTGLIGQNYGGLVHAGLAFKMGDTVSIPEMLTLQVVNLSRRELFLVCNLVSLITKQLTTV